MRTLRLECFVLLATACGLFLGTPGFSQEAGDAGNFKAAEGELKAAAKEAEVVEDLEEPDGVALDDLDSDNWKIFAIGSATYEFNTTDDRQSATSEATQKAKAALAKFVKEELMVDEQFDELTEKESKRTKSDGSASASASSKSVKTSLTTIRNSAKQILSGILTLETTAKWMGDSGEVRVKIGQSQKTLDAAGKFSKRTAAATAPPSGGSRDGGGPAKGPGTDAGGSGQPETMRRKSKSSL